MATQRERSQATSTRLLTAARALFAAQGYAATAVDAIVARARVTKGAFYHHFEDKPAVFRAVLEAESQQLVAAAMSQRSGADPLSQFKSACFSYLRACLDPGVQRIVLHDGPAVLGWRTWREIDWRFGLAALEGGLSNLMAAGVLRRRPTRTLAHLLVGALCESALVISRAARPRRASQPVRGELEVLFTALLTQPAPGAAPRTTAAAPSRPARARSRRPAAP